MTKIFTLLAGQSCRSALNSWAAQRRPADDVKIFDLRPFLTLFEYFLDNWPFLAMKLWALRLSMPIVWLFSFFRTACQHAAD
jgi:hypothetical protein